MKSVITAILIIFTINTAQASHYYLQLVKVKEIGKHIAILSYCIENVWLKESAPAFVQLRDELRGYDYAYEMQHDIPDNVANEAFVNGVNLGTRMARKYGYDRSRCIEEYVTSIKFMENEKQQ